MAAPHEPPPARSDATTLPPALVTPVSKAKPKVCTAKKRIGGLRPYMGRRISGTVEQSIVAEMGSYSHRSKGLSAVVDDRMEAMTRCIARSRELWF